MDEYSDTSSSGGNLLKLLLVAIFFVVGVLTLIAFNGKDQNPNATNDNDTRTLASGNEVLSRNQINFMSDVENNFYDCYGAGACVVDNSQTSSSNTVTTDTRTVTVNGNQNTVVGSDGVLLCQDPVTGIFTPSVCQQ